MKSRPPIIVGGFYRSGTSLVRRLLDSHSHIHCPSEIKWFKDFYGDYPDDDLGQVRFFKTLRSLGLPENELLEIYGQTYIQCRERAAQHFGCSRWADKNPENVLYLNQWAQLLGDNFVFVYVVRHPMDALSSLCEIGFQKAVPANFHLKVDLLKKYYEAAQAFEACHKERFFCLRYEDLVDKSELSLSRLFLWLGENYEPEVLKRFWWDERISGIEDPKVKQTRGIHSDSIDRWKHDLNNQQIDIVMNTLSAEMEYFGYVVEST